ncbi:hypothetical protein EVAR_99326_1 [Eumeta japonica]|uniref:Amine oxidase domain-containing protein n=1 Tax=Eumeta variegata TaxID=151549 RepID=A0A4C1ZT92_EUMVA|nr:hypothetical protein EVAR_99326_1 [Eumeta japonica]
MISLSFRPGGRIHSCWLGDVVVELGADWTPVNNESHPLFKITTSEKPPWPGVPGAPHPRGLFNRVEAGKLESYPMYTAYYKYKQIETEANEMYRLGGNKQHGSLMDFISLRIQQELNDFSERQRHDAARIIFGLLQMRKTRSVYDTAMLSVDYEGSFMNASGGQARVALGLAGILEPLMRQIPLGCIRYCKPVECVCWGTAQSSGYRATVHTCDGDVFPADYVISTFPLGVLHRDAEKLFCPNLPAAKTNAFRCLCVNHYNKVFAEFGRPYWFWTKSMLRFCFTPNDLSHRSDWTRGVTSIQPVANSQHVVCAWVAGSGAAALEAASDAEVIEGIAEVLRSAACDPCLPFPNRILRSQWTTLPYFGGAYSWDESQSSGMLQCELGLPLPGPGEPVPPILLFAGEATAPGYYGTVSGARLSGVREAERVLQLTEYFQGPPVPALGITDVTTCCVADAAPQKAVAS